MPDVVSNTSPLLYLHQLGLLEILPTLYTRVVVPDAVAAEIADGARLGYAVPELARLSWLDIATPSAGEVLKLTTDLDAGERAAIALAIERKSDLLIIDDNLARKHAALIGVVYTGTLGVLLKAKSEKRIVAILPLVDQLEGLGFRLATATRAAVLRLAGE